MLFITNRALQEGPTPTNPDGSPREVPRQINFDLNNNQAEQSVYFCRRNALSNYTEIGSSAFFNELKNAPIEQIVLFFHGYNSLPETSIFQTASDLQSLFDQQSPAKLLVVPLIWPCDNDLGLVQDYFDDQIAADASAFAYARLFEKFLGWRDENSTDENPCTKRINMLAHSMGARVLRGALKLAVQYYQPNGLPLVFRNTFLPAADIVNEALEPGQEGEHISYTSRNVVVYYAADDLALRSSKVANLRGGIVSRRLGHTGPEKMEQVPKNVYAIDCDDFNNQYDNPLGHTYFMRDTQGNPGLVFRHIWQCIRTGRVPIQAPNRSQILTENVLRV